MSRDYWTPVDVDVFLPFGASRDADQADRDRSEAVFTAVMEHVCASMEDTLFTALELGPKSITVTYRAGDYEFDVARVHGHLGEGADEGMTVEEFKQRVRVQERWREPAPEHCSTARTYPLSLLRQLPGMAPAQFLTAEDFVHEERILEAQEGLRDLRDRGLLDGNGTVGRTRAYRIARVMDIDATVERPKTTGVDAEAVRFPTKVNLVQYHGEPLRPLELLGSFDLPPPQIAVRPCAAGSALPAFELTPAARLALATRELRFTPYTWGPCYAAPDETGSAFAGRVLTVPARVQLERISKYVRRGFRLPA